MYIYIHNCMHIDKGMVHQRNPKDSQNWNTKGPNHVVLYLFKPSVWADGIELPGTTVTIINHNAQRWNM